MIIGYNAQTGESPYQIPGDCAMPKSGTPLKRLKRCQNELYVVSW